MTRESARLSVSGFELHVDRWHGGDRAQVLLLHGLGGNSATWHGVAPLLAHAGAHVLAVNLPGFGPSRPDRRRVSVALLTELLAAVMKREAPSGTPWVLAGNSLGGTLALELACRHSERVAGVSLAALALPLTWGRSIGGISGLFSFLPAAVPWVGRQLIASYMTRTGLPGVVDEPVRALFGDPARLDAGLREELLGVSKGRLTWVRDAARAYEQATLSLGWQLLAPSGEARSIRETRCPVQVIHGGRDPIFPAAALRKLSRVRPDWDYAEMPDVGHVPQLEAPTDVAALLLAWLERRQLFRA